MSYINFYLCNTSNYQLTFTDYRSPQVKTTIIYVNNKNIKRKRNITSAIQKYY